MAEKPIDVHREDSEIIWRATENTAVSELKSRLRLWDNVEGALAA
jgi:hypothetical protein